MFSYEDAINTLPFSVSIEGVGKKAYNEDIDKEPKGGLFHG